jgi:hypothetical protein
MDMKIANWVVKKYYSSYCLFESMAFLQNIHWAGSSFE